MDIRLTKENTVLPDGTIGECMAVRPKNYSGFYNNYTVEIPTDDCTGAESVTFSIYMRSELSHTAVINVCGSMNSERNQDYTYPSKLYSHQIDKTWKRFVVSTDNPGDNTVKITFDQLNGFLLDLNNPNAEDVIYMYKAQLELGSDVTEWVAPEDQLVTGNKLKTMIEARDDGLHVGNNRDSREVLIDSESVKIRKESRTLAEFIDEGLVIYETNGQILASFKGYACYLTGPLNASGGAVIPADGLNRLMDFSGIRYRIGSHSVYDAESGTRLTYPVYKQAFEFSGISANHNEVIGNLCNESAGYMARVKSVLSIDGVIKTSGNIWHTLPYTGSSSNIVRGYVSANGDVYVNNGTSNSVSATVTITYVADLYRKESTP